MGIRNWCDLLIFVMFSCEFDLISSLVYQTMHIVVTAVRY
jgi:hypothetical protein